MLPLPWPHGPSPVLSFDKQVSRNFVQAGQLLTYTLTLTNSGGVEATGITISDTIPVNTVLITASLTGGAVISQGTVYWAEQTAPALSTQVYQFQTTTPLSLSEETNITNTAYAYTGTWPILDMQMVFSDTTLTKIDNLPPQFPGSGTLNQALLITPTQGITVNTAQPLFTWKTAMDASQTVQYQILITKHQASTATIDDVITQTNYRPLISLDDGIYNWTVRAFDEADNSTAFIPAEYFGLKAIERIYLPLLLR